MIKKFYFILLMGVSTMSFCQKTDTVIVDLTKSSRILLTIKDRKDLETLKHYDFQKLFQDAISKLEKSDSMMAMKIDSVKTPTAKRDDDDNDDNILQLPEHKDSDDDTDSHEKNSKNWYGWRDGHRGKNHQSFKFDLGTNNYLSKSKFPDQDNANYAVRPWGSWYLAINSIHRSTVSKKFFLEWGGGVSWYNFKFENNSTFIQKTNDNVDFILDPRGFKYSKSKLTATYLNASFVPVIEFGHPSEKATWNGHKNPFRVGLGPYVGYRIASHSKLVYDDDNGRTQKEKHRDSFYLNNMRYGARVQVGFWHTDLFFNYDMNELFVSGKGPDLNAFSFGVVF
jgi:hypothetical protein